MRASLIYSSVSIVVYAAHECPYVIIWKCFGRKLYSSRLSKIWGLGLSGLVLTNIVQNSRMRIDDVCRLNHSLLFSKTYLICKFYALVLGLQWIEPLNITKITKHYYASYEYTIFIQQILYNDLAWPIFTYFDILFWEHGTTCSQTRTYTHILTSYITNLSSTAALSWLLVGFGRFFLFLLVVTVCFFLLCLIQFTKP
jgi:hypothetical protein